MWQAAVLCSLDCSRHFWINIHQIRHQVSWLFSETEPLNKTISGRFPAPFSGALMIQPSLKIRNPSCVASPPVSEENSNESIISGKQSSCFFGESLPCLGHEISRIHTVLTVTHHRLESCSLFSQWTPNFCWQKLTNLTVELGEAHRFCCKTQNYWWHHFSLGETYAHHLPARR